MFEGMNTFQSAVQTVGFLFFFLFVCLFLPYIDTTQRITVRWFLTGVLAGLYCIKTKS